MDPRLPINKFALKGRGMLFSYGICIRGLIPFLSSPPKGGFLGIKPLNTNKTGNRACSEIRLKARSIESREAVLKTEVLEQFQLLKIPVVKAALTAVFLPFVKE
jgi:hypothetical protein